MINELLQLPLYTAPAHNSSTDITYTHNGSGDLLILVHGSLCDLRYWRWQLNRLHLNCQVVALSLPGCWPNDINLTPYEFDFDLHVAAIADVVRAIRQPQQKIYVLGHSRGALVAANYAWQYTEQIDGLILADPAFTPDQALQPLSVIEEAAELLINEEDEKGLGLFIDAVSGAHTWQQMVGWFKTMVEDNATTLIAQSRESLPVITSTQIHQLENIPLLLLNGANSPNRYKSSAQALLKQLPQAKHIIIDKASHGMNLANPKAFNSAILDFMQN